MDLDRTTVLIGENNVGKSSLLEAIHIVLSRGLTRRAVPFSEYDFHLAAKEADPTASLPITITLFFEEQQKDEWPDEIAQAFPNVIQTLGDGRQALSFRVTAAYDSAVRDITVEWAFLDQAGNQLPARQATLLGSLQQLVPIFLLTAVRDAAQQFAPRSAFWGPFTRNLEITDERRADLENQIEQINQSVLDSHKPFEVVKERMSEVGKLMPLAPSDLVSVEAVPARVSDMLSRTQVKLAALTGARLPLAQHGAGTQSLSVLFLFEAFLQSRLAESFDAQSEPILALEEPESHLHPSAIRALWPTLASFGGQKIVATHSGDLAAVTPLSAIRRLARKGGQVGVFRVKDGTLSSIEARRVAYHIRAKRGALLFARAWLLVEGESDFTLLPEIARILGYDFDLLGIACVEYSQCWPVPLIKVAKELGIEWHLLADGDPAGAKYQRAARSLLAGDAEAQRITRLSDFDIERSFWSAGFEAVFEAAVDKPHRRLITAAKGSPTYVKQTINAAIKSTSKPYVAAALAVEATNRGASSLPIDLVQAAKQTVALAAA